MFGVAKEVRAFEMEARDVPVEPVERQILEVVDPVSIALLFDFRVNRDVCSLLRSLDRACRASTSSTTATAGQAGDDDVEDGDDAVDDGHEDCANAVDDGHEDRADGTEDRGDLKGKVRTRS